MVGADLEVMRRDSLRMRGERPFTMVSLRDDQLAAVNALDAQSVVDAYVFALGVLGDGRHLGRVSSAVLS